MSETTNRRSFLRGKFAARQAPLRPPWALAEHDFLSLCTRCGECTRSCPTKIISERDAGYPVIDFSAGECTFCAGCVTACTTGALQKSVEQPPWTARAQIGDSCLARQRVECRVCGELCAAGAIRFPPVVGGSAIPQLDLPHCTGCGACVAPCPARAITVG
jgi:ferredoxin-type protein NapF